MYGDLGLKRGPKLLWNRYIQTRQQLGYYHWKELVPVIATWDDHDYGKNDTDGYYPHKVNSAETFKTFFAQEPRAGVLSNGPGISSVFQAFGQQFVFADNRTYRNLPASYGAGFFGEEQLQWMFANLKPGVPVWLMQGSQTFLAKAGQRRQCIEGKYAEEFEPLCKSLAAMNVPAAFTSGDIHSTEIMHIGPEYLGFDTYELTASSLHSFPPFVRPENSRREQAIWRENFVVVDLKPSDSELVFQMSGVGEGRRVYFSEEIVIG